jgi:Lysyl oxidase
MRSDSFRRWKSLTDFLIRRAAKSSRAQSGGTGYRRLLRFETTIINGGDGDLVVGSPTDPNNPYHSVFIFSPCHMHDHIIGFADYKLLRQDGSTAAAGHKQAFCLEDIYKYANDNKSSGYACASQETPADGPIPITSS